MGFLVDLKSPSSVFPALMVMAHGFLSHPGLVSSLTLIIILFVHTEEDDTPDHHF